MFSLHLAFIWPIAKMGSGNYRFFLTIYFGFTISRLFLANSILDSYQNPFFSAIYFWIRVPNRFRAKFIFGFIPKTVFGLNLNLDSCPKLFSG
jgi:hypothetical protein